MTKKVIDMFDNTIANSVYKNNYRVDKMQLCFWMGGERMGFLL